MFEFNFKFSTEDNQLSEMSLTKIQELIENLTDKTIDNLEVQIIEHTTENGNRSDYRDDLILD